MYRTLLVVLISATTAAAVVQTPSSLMAPSAAGPAMTYSSYLGGTLSDRATAVASCPDGGLVFVGTTGSGNFPTTPGAEQGLRQGFSDSFVAKLDAAGALEWATYLGATDSSGLLPERASDVAVAPDGSITVVGTANGDDFPTTPGAAQEQSLGKLDGYVAHYNALGELQWATYLGGSGDDYASSVALDAQGRAVVVGRTFSQNFPTTPGAFDETENSLNFLFNDAWVARIAADGSAIEWATYLGGLLRDEAHAVAVANDGSVFVAGLSGSPAFPTTPGAFDETYNGASGSKTDAFLLRLSAAGDALIWSTYFGGLDIVEGLALALDAQGRPVIAGRTLSDDLPGSALGFQPNYAGGDSDGYLAGFSADGSQLRFASYVGGSGRDSVRDLSLSAAGQPTMVGFTTSANFPVLGLQLPPSARGSSSSGAGGTLGPNHAGPAGPGALFGNLDALLGVGADGELSGALDGFVLRTRRAGEQLVASSYLGASGNEEAAGLAHDALGRVIVTGHTNSEDFQISDNAAQDQLRGADDAFVQRLHLPPVLSLASARAGALGRVAGLRVTGALEPDSTLELRVSAPADTSLVQLAVGTEFAPRYLARGVWLPGGPVRLFSIPVVTTGTSLSVVWPRGVPSGTQLVLQAITRTNGRWVLGDGALLVAP